jgi:hypothetical protein
MLLLHLKRFKQFFIIIIYLKLFPLNYSVIGSLIIVIGLYFVLWGKGRELKKTIEQKQTKDLVEDQPSEIITTKLEDEDNKSVEIEAQSPCRMRDLDRSPTVHEIQQFVVAVG